MNDIKRFEIYVFGTTFSRALIEVFIPAILFKFGYLSLFFLSKKIISTEIYVSEFGKLEHTMCVHMVRF